MCCYDLRCSQHVAEHRQGRWRSPTVFAPVSPKLASIQTPSVMRTELMRSQACKSDWFDCSPPGATVQIASAAQNKGFPSTLTHSGHHLSFESDSIWGRSNSPFPFLEAGNAGHLLLLNSFDESCFTHALQGLLLYLYQQI